MFAKVGRVASGMLLGFLSVAVPYAFPFGIAAMKGWDLLIPSAVMSGLSIVLARRRPQWRLFAIGLVTTAISLFILASAT